jgi:predicted RNase H-like HicB family nuclease
LVKPPIVDLDEVAEHVFHSPLSLEECRVRLAGALADIRASTPHGHPPSVSGDVGVADFTLRQEELESPLNVQRTVEGTLQAIPHGTRVAFRLRLREYPFGTLHADRRALQVVRILLGAAWRAFDDEEAAFVQQFLERTLGTMPAPPVLPHVATTPTLNTPPVLDPVDIVTESEPSSPPSFEDALADALEDADEVTVTMLRYAVVIETTEEGYSAYVPDFLGCMVESDTIEGVEQALVDSVVAYLNDLLDAQEPIPEVKTFARVIDVRA